MGLFNGATAPPAESRFVAPVLGSFEAKSYATVDGSKISTSLQSVAVGSTVDLICSLGSELPVHVFRGEGADRKKITTPGYLEDPGGDGNGLPDWIYQVLMSWTLRGNLYGDILQVAPSGFPTQVLPYYPDDVTGKLGRKGRIEWYVKGKLVEDNTRFLHRRVMPVPGHVLGLSPITQRAATIGVSLASTRFGSQWFSDGGHPTSLLSTDANLDPDQATTAKKRFLEIFNGKREPLVLGNGWKYQALQMNPEESQFLETQNFSEAQCARIFGPGFAEILGYESGGNLTYANIESRATHLLVFGMNRWLRRVDRLLTSMLPRPQYARIDRDAMLESTTLTRYLAHASALDKRWKTVNEVRGDEDLAPVEWGDQPNSAGPAAPAPTDPPTDQPTPGGNA